MAPRFYTSPYKNSLTTPSKREQWWTELPISSGGGNNEELIKCASEYWIAQGSRIGSLIVNPYNNNHDKSGNPSGRRYRSIETQGLGSGISSFEVSQVGEELLAIGGENGSINISKLPQLSEFPEINDTTTTTTTLSLDPLLTISPHRSLSKASSSINQVLFHPTTSNLFLSSTSTSIQIYNLENSQEPIYEIDPITTGGGSSNVSDVRWTRDGRLVSCTMKDGKLKIWDVRVDSNKVVAETICHSGLNKPIRHVHLSSSSSSSPSSEGILTTGFSRTRDREISLFDPRNLSSVVKRERVDNGLGVLNTCCDEERGIVYLVGKGDVSLKEVQIGGPQVFTQTSTPFPSQIQSASLVPPHHLDLMSAEINRLVVVTNQDQVVPVNVKVPRRQYLDFHKELYPEVKGNVPSQTVQEWIKGEDGRPVDRVQPDPEKPFFKRFVKDSTSISSDPVASTISSSNSTTTSTKPSTASTTMNSDKQDTSPSSTIYEKEQQKEGSLPSKPTSQPQPAQSFVTPSAAALTIESSASDPKTISKPAQVVQEKEQEENVGSIAQPEEKQTNPIPSFSSSLSIDEENKRQTPASDRSPSIVNDQSRPSEVTTPETVNSSSTSTSKLPFNPSWSRNFLLGKTPLKPDYFDVKDLSVTMSAEVELIKATPRYFFYPLSGPGGRLAVHPLTSKGRLPVHVPALVSGSSIVNFDTDPFGSETVSVACEDDGVRVFEVPEGMGGGEEREGGRDCGEPLRILKDSSMNKINVLRYHPSAKEVLLTVSDDRGSPKARVWNTETGELLLTTELPAGGVSSAAWSPDGSRLAISTKKKEILVLDPRNPSSISRCAAHESIRPAMIAWSSNRHLVTTGFTRSSTRELILYELNDNAELRVIGKQLLDVSPALLIPFVDQDTNILLAYSRGERSCFAFEINHNPSSPSSAFSKLPSFEHGTLQSGFAWYPKTQNDVKEVEVVKALRLTPGTVEVISFTVPRMKTEYFQDDIFVPTRNRETPSMTCQEWIEGKNTPLEIVDLCPVGMKPLSEAPQAQKTVSTRSKIKNDGLTDSQRETQYMDRLFESAKEENGTKGGDESEDDEPQIGRSRIGAPDDDDDW